jgi:Na+/H+-dicarboxylate symporter
LSKNLAFVGLVYLDLLGMIVMPFMVSAVIFSIQRLLKDGGAGKILGKITMVFVVFSLVGALAAAVGTLFIEPGGQMSIASKAAMGKIIGESGDNGNIAMALRSVEEQADVNAVTKVVGSLIPSNIFDSLAKGETLKALVFSLLFGFAVGHLQGRASDSMGQTLETVYQACQLLTRWVNIPVPLVLICMTASQIGHTGFDPLVIMMEFVVAFSVVSLVLLAVSVLILRWRSGRSLAVVFDSMRETLTLGVATNSSANCMPAMVDGLVERLHFARARVELLVPLSVSLLRVGAVAYFVCGALFVAELYDRHLTAVEVGLVVLVSALSGFASAGMAGILTISLIGTACTYLGLPFEAAFILFVAVDPLCAMVRTAVTVICCCAAVSIVCDEPNGSAEVDLQPLGVPRA